MNPHYLHKVIFATAFLILGMQPLSSTLLAQLTIQWDRTYGGLGWEELQAMALAKDGGYLFGGITTTTQASSEVAQNTRDTVDWPQLTGDFWLVKSDSTGNPVWTKRYGGDGQDRIWSIRPTADGGYLLGGESWSNVWADRTKPSRGGADYWIVKIDGEGNIEWDEAFGGSGNDFLREVIPLPDGGFLPAGFSDSEANGDKTDHSRGGSDFWIIRLNPDRSIAWQKTFGGTGEDQLYDAVKAHDSGFLLAGWSASPVGFEKTAPFYGMNDFWIIKIDASGNILWQRTLGGDKEDVCQAICPTQDGQYLFVGQSSSTPDTGNKSSENFGQWDAWIVKVNDLGNSSTITWQHSYGGASGDIAYGAVQNVLGDYLVVGLSFSEPDTLSTNPNSKVSPLLGASDLWVLFLEPNGEKLWEETLGGTNTDAGIKIANAHGYGYILAGHSSSMVSPPYKSDPSRGLNDMWVVRTGCSFPGPELSDLPKVCKDDFIEVDATISANCEFCQYFWDDGGTGALRSFSPDTTTQVKVTVLHPDGCTLSDSVIIEIVPGPEAMLADEEPVSCFGKADARLQVQSVQGGAPPYLFSLNGGDWETKASYVNMAPGIYSLQILDFNECKYDTTFFIEQPEEVLVDLGPDIFINFGDSVQLQALTNLLDSFSFEWGQPQLLSCVDCLEPWVSTFYTTTISIRVVDKKGCEARDFLRVVVEKNNSVFIPNVFSPNNDNINDFFTVYADASVRKVNRLLVFDRWGEKMFEAQNFLPNIEQIGWNGHLNGKPLKPAVFTYFAEVEYVDGKTGFFEGGLTLMR